MRRILALALAAGLVACATKHTTATGNLRLGKTPEENYQKGIDELKAKNFPEAIRFFEYVKAKYPFSSVSVASDLRLADVKFAQERWSEAAAAYESFIKEHPSSPDLEQAEFRAGVAHRRSAPGDFFLLPPAEEKDQSDTEKAVELLRAFVQKHPDSRYLPEARKELLAAETVLAGRELYAGDFYFKRKHWAGAADRYKGLTENYPATPQAEPALLKLARSYVEMKETFQARQTLQRLIAQHPRSRERYAAEKLLDALR